MTGFWPAKLPSKYRDVSVSNGPQLRLPTQVEWQRFANELCQRSDRNAVSFILAQDGKGR